MLCQPSTVVLIPAPSLSPRSRPPGRSCALSPARRIHPACQTLSSILAPFCLTLPQPVPPSLFLLCVPKPGECLENGLKSFSLSSCNTDATLCVDQAKLRFPPRRGSLAVLRLRYFSASSSSHAASNIRQQSIMFPK